MTLILVLPLMDALMPPKTSDGQMVSLRSRIIPDYLPLLAVAIAYLAVRRAVLGGIMIAGNAIAPLDNPMVPISVMPLGERLGATTGQALMTPFAVGRGVRPTARLAGTPVARLLGTTRFRSSRACSTCGSFPEWLSRSRVRPAIVVLWRRSPVAAFGVAFAAATFSIVSNLAITIGTICAERLMYLPSAGVLIAAAVGAERLVDSGQGRRRIACAALAVVLVLGAVRTTRRNRDWETDSTLWSAAILAAPGSARVQSEYGRLMMGRAEDAARTGRTADAETLYAEARAHLETAVQIYPSYSLPIDSLAMIDSLHNRFDDAMVDVRAGTRSVAG